MEQFDKEKIVKNKNNTMSKINEYLDNCLLLDDKHIKKVSLLSYWLNDYIKYIEQEEIFNSSKLKSYSRGDVIKVNLGFNIGNEEGGLHYCVVLDKKNAKSFSTLTVVPLSSLKSSTKVNKTSVFIGNELYESLSLKNASLLLEAKSNLEIFEEELRVISELPTETQEDNIVKEFRIKEIMDKIQAGSERLELVKKISDELAQIKTGSIVLTNQITTISKQRIYNPKKEFDILSGIKISDEKMKLIDEKIKKLYIN